MGAPSLWLRAYIYPALVKPLEHSIAAQPAVSPTSQRLHDMKIWEMFTRQSNPEPVILLSELRAMLFNDGEGDACLSAIVEPSLESHLSARDEGSLLHVSARWIRWCCCTPFSTCSIPRGCPPHNAGLWCLVPGLDRSNASDGKCGVVLCCSKSRWSSSIPNAAAKGGFQPLCHIFPLSASIAAHLLSRTVIEERFHFTTVVWTISVPSICPLSLFSVNTTVAVNL